MMSEYTTVFEAQLLALVWIEAFGGNTSVMGAENEGSDDSNV